MLSAESLKKIDREIAKYPPERKQSAVISALAIAQDEKGWLSSETMEYVAQYLGMPPVAVYEVASFYTMFKREPVGTYLVSVCTNIACLIDGGFELLEHAEHSLGVRPDGTTVDGLFTLEEVECLAHCDKAPCLQVNYRFFGPVTPDDFDRLCDDLRSHRLERDVPRHGVLNRDTRPHPMSAARDGT